MTREYLGAADGSSPRRRGKRARNRVGQLVPGLIPAQAGKTSTRLRAATRTPAHPRAGGENN